MMPAPYRIYAIQYAHRETHSSECFHRDYHRTPMGMDYYVWAITNDQHTVVVDLGFTEAVGTRRGRQFLRDPGAALTTIGIDAARVERVIITHFHYDHVGNHALFPRAVFHVQDEEMRFWTGRYARQPAFAGSLEVDDVAALVRYAAEGRVRFVDGDEEIVPGVAVHRVGGHTAGMQIVSVQTERGRAVLTSDASHYYRNLEDNVPFNTLHDLPGAYHAFERIRALADAPDLVMPGHDPLVLERLRPVAPGIVLLAPPARSSA
ncbi:MAG: N-acyl homoserine lactonase family protein [Dehalococcoidia bacterium]